MKPINKISLSSLALSELKNSEKLHLSGGIDLPPVTVCGAKCPCKYAGPQECPDDSFWGGSSKEYSSAELAKDVKNS